MTPNHKQHTAVHHPPELRIALRYILFDILSAMLAWALLFIFRKIGLENLRLPDIGQVFADANFWRGIVIVPLGWLALYALQGTYKNVLRKSRLKEFQQTLTASLIGVVVLFFALLIDDQVGNYRGYYLSFLFLFAVHFGLTYLCRVIQTSSTVRKVHRRQIGFPTLLIGSHNKAYQTYLDLENQETYSGNIFAGYVEIEKVGKHPNETDVCPPDILNPLERGEEHPVDVSPKRGSISFQPSVRADTGVSPYNSPPEESRLASVIPCLGTVASVRQLIADHHIEEVIIAVEDNEQQHLQQILRTLDGCGDVIIKITPDARDIILGMVRVDSIFHSPLITINTRLMEEWQYSVKRLFDILLSLLALILLSPVFLITAIIVKCTSPGPVFYTQERIGYQGRPFKMHKFRTMYTDAEACGPALSRDDDPRITPFGRFMRKVRLDEIPQFYNVLKGTMSIVGYRPERQFYIDQIVRRCPEYLLLQRIKPGITSWGQVKYGYASSVDEMCERLKYDLLYLENMSVTTDIKILIYTIGIIFQGRGK
jgi:lipopolysaccharide/colanic/teichoic acid biosynthesis glycosyltransferase